MHQAPHNVLSILLLGFSIGLGSPGVSAQSQPMPSSLFQELQSSQTTDRALQELLRIGQSDTETREYLTAHLPGMIERGPTNSRSQWFNAVELAGKLKIVEAAPALAKWIEVTTGIPTRTLSGESHLRSNPAGTALVRIGDPAIPALEGLLQRGNLAERYKAVYALSLIGSPKAKDTLRAHATRESDDTLLEIIKKSGSNGRE